MKSKMISPLGSSFGFVAALVYACSSDGGFQGQVPGAGGGGGSSSGSSGTSGTSGSSGSSASGGSVSDAGEGGEGGAAGEPDMPKAGDVCLSCLDDGADLAGTMKVDPLSPRSVLAVLKEPEPKTTDPKALTRFAGSANWALGKDSLSLSKADFTLDQTHLTGSLGFAPLEDPVTRFDLAIDAIDLDRYLEPAPAEGGGGGGAKTGDTDIPALSKQTIHPYTDLLLHDMGDELADGRPDFEATGKEWRTPPLWGIGLTETVNGHTQFLHDGRARNLLEAILWHGGEAESARQKVLAFDAGQRDALLAFLNSL